MKKHVFIATPAFDGRVHIPYALSLAELIYALRTKGIGVSTRLSASGSLLVAERNKLVEEFYRSDATHMLCIDADLGYPAEAVLAMLDADKEFVAGVYPARNEAKEANEFLYRPKLKHGDLIEADRHLLGAEYIPSGFMLLSRSCITKMREKFPELYYCPRDPKKKDEHAYCLFETQVWNGEFWGEDYIFCRRAREAGVEIWVDPLIEFDHAGRRGMLIQYLKEQEAEAKKEVTATFRQVSNDDLYVHA